MTVTLGVGKWVFLFGFLTPPRRCHQALVLGSVSKWFMKDSVGFFLPTEKMDGISIYIYICIYLPTFIYIFYMDPMGTLWITSRQFRNFAPEFSAALPRRPAACNKVVTASIRWKWKARNDANFIIISWFFTDSTMVNRHFSPPFGRICLELVSKHPTSKSKSWFSATKVHQENLYAK